MEENLLVRGGGGGGENWEEEEVGFTRWVLVLVEVKRLGCLAAPMVVVVLLQYFIQIVSVMMVGHLGELALSSTAVALSISGITGFSFLVSSISACFGSCFFKLFFRIQITSFCCYFKTVFVYLNLLFFLYYLCFLDKIKNYKSKMFYVFFLFSLFFKTKKRTVFKNGKQTDRPLFSFFFFFPLDNFLM